MPAILECDDCQRQLVDRRRNGRDTLFRHFLRLHAKLKKEERLACDDCHWTFVARHHLQRHIRICHRITLTAADVVTCDQCSKKFRSKDRLHKHIHARHPTRHVGGGPATSYYGCAECDFATTKDRKSLVGHLSRKHGTVDADFRCHLCRIKFSNYTGLFEHRRVKHADAEKLMQCDDCGQELCQSSLAGHTIYKHLLDYGERSICDICERRFEHKGLVRLHIRGHHWGTYFQYCCDECGLVYTSKRELVIHAFHHLQLRLMFECDQCDLSWSRLQCLEEHLRTQHFDARPTCDSCSKSFRLRISLAEHYGAQHQLHTNDDGDSDNCR